MTTTHLLKIYVFALMFLSGLNSLAQSTSVFEACYFKRDNTEPPLKIGKGFHINDVYKQTNYCFTPVSSSTTHLKAQESSQKTSINIYYTNNNEQYNNLKNTGSSGKISFLNIFSIGGQNSESFSSNTFQNTERLIIIEKIDFGVYSYDNNLTLTPQAQALISKNKTSEFIEAYGTHYISGVRKENSIWIILTKISSGSTTNQYSKSNSEFSINIPYKAKGSLEINEGDEIEKLLNSNSFAVSVEINGPPLKQDLLKSIQQIMNNKEENKLVAIKDILGSAAANISNPSQSKISQYYYTPFTLKGLKGIYWDEKKQNQLIKINEAAAQIYTLKSKIEPLASFSGQSIISKEFDAQVAEYSKSKEHKTELLTAYKEQQPNLKLYKAKLDSFLLLLEKNYLICSDIFCSNSDCCNQNSFQEEMKETFFKSHEAIGTLESIIATSAKESYEELTPVCEKKNTSTLIVRNRSLNPYNFYNNDQFIKVLKGGEEYSFTIKPGAYNFKAVQRSGYLLYATENLRPINILKPCESKIFEVGFED